MGDRSQLGEVACLAGHAAADAGRSPSSHLERARSLAAAVGAGEGSLLHGAIATLARAAAAWAGGRPLVRGFCPEDLAAPQLAWLRERDPGMLPAAACGAPEPGTHRRRRARVAKGSTMAPTT